jgi:hypothetical protein
VEAELGLHRLGDLADLGVEGGVQEGGVEAGGGRDAAEVPGLGRGGGVVVGVGGGQLGEVGPALDLLVQLLGPGRGLLVGARARRLGAVAGADQGWDTQRLSNCSMFSS